MNLSEHFTLAELTASDTAARAGIDNKPNDSEIANLASLCEEILEPLRATVGPVQVTSGFRCIPLNRRIGSKDTSHHTMGRAADIKVAGMKPLDVCELIVSMGLGFEQCISEFATPNGGGWTHVSIPENGKAPKRQCLTIDRLGTRPGLHPAR